MCKLFYLHATANELFGETSHAYGLGAFANGKPFMTMNTIAAFVVTIYKSASTI